MSISVIDDVDRVSSFKIRMANDLADFAGLWPRTDHSGPAHCFAFQCAEMLEIWCDTIGRATETQSVFVAVFDDVGRPLLLLPFGIVRHRGIRILGFLDGAANDYNAPVVFEPLRTWTRDTLERLWQELLRVLPRFDVAMLEKMPSDICGAPNPLVGLGTPSRSGHLVNITTSWDEYAAHRLPYKRESVIQRRKLGKLGKVAFTVAETAADRQRMLQTMMRQKSRRYVETRGIDGLDRPGFRQYYNAMIERLGWPGPLFICALEVDGHVIATNWGFISNKRFLGIITSFEGGEWKRFSPGRLLLEDLLKWNFDNGSMIFDFGSGEESYKLPYCDEALSLYQANIPVTLVGKAYVYRLGRDTKIWRFVRRCARFAKLIAGRPAAQR